MDVVGIGLTAALDIVLELQSAESLNQKLLIRDRCFRLVCPHFDGFEGVDLDEIRSKPELSCSAIWYHGC